MSAAFAGAVDLSALKSRAAGPAGPGAAGPAAPGAPAGAPAAGAGEPSPYIVDVDEPTFGSLVQASTQLPIILNFEAAWAEPGSSTRWVL